jgi:hypothetical protein
VIVLYYRSAAITFIFKTHSKNTSKSDNTIFYMARKSFIFLSFHVYKKFHETRDVRRSRHKVTGLYCIKYLCTLNTL